MAEVWVCAEQFDYGKGKKREAEHRAGIRLLRKALEGRFGLVLEDEEALSFAVGPHGKPYLKEFPEIEFNISHCSGLAVCAVGDCPLGVDIEKERRYREALPSQALSESELRFLTVEEPEILFRFWTLKESYVKAVGCGITIPFPEISFTLEEESGKIRCSQPGFQFWQRRLFDGYVLAVCAGTEEEVKLRWKLPAELPDRATECDCGL